MTTTAARHPASKHAQPHPAKPKPRTGFESWVDGIDKADSAWDVYDCEIRSAVGEFNMHLSHTPRYVPLDWLTIKAMLWVETGAHREREWRTRPMQIGNPTDPGMMALLGDRDGGELILPRMLRAGLSVGSVTSNPAANIRAGIGYLLMRMATFAFRDIPDADSTVYETTVGHGDTIERLARANGSTPATMKQMNPSIGLLRAGQVLKYRKAAVRKVITGWMPITATSIATRYNVGDASYARKLNHTPSAVRRTKEAACR